MRIDVTITPENFHSDSSEGKRVVVVDVLRASTTIITALARGAKKMYPLATPEEVKERARSFSKNEILLCGEREGIRISGFDLGNSPREYKECVVRGKVLFFTSTNGSRMLAKARGAGEILIGSFVNMAALIRRLDSNEKDCLVACSGHNGGFSLEDGVCAGMIVDRLKNEMPQHSIEMGDEARAAMILYRRFADDLENMARQSSWGKHLTELGFVDDLPVCTSVDLHNIVPVLKGEELVLEYS